MTRHLSVVFRGHLASCNYACGYCPFAKRASRSEELEADRHGVERFVEWVGSQADFDLQILFAPWGEALLHTWYPASLVRLSHIRSVHRVAIQTNLSASTDWIGDADLQRLELWTTYHPSQVRADCFLDRLRHLDAYGVRYSVGIVGLREHIPVAQELRRAMPSQVYLWVNAFKRGGPGYYTDSEKRAFEAIDPLFPMSAVEHTTLGESCRAGASAIAVDGSGAVRRCLFVPEVFGNLYATPLKTMLREQPCPNRTCRCYLGYMHLDRLGLRDVYGDGLMARVPSKPQFQTLGRTEHATVRA